MGSRVPSQEHAETKLIRMGYRKHDDGGYYHPSGAGFTPLDMQELSPYELLREGRRMIEFMEGGDG